MYSAMYNSTADTMALKLQKNDILPFYVLSRFNGYIRNVIIGKFNVSTLQIWEL